MNNPFRYTPHPAVKAAADRIMKQIGNSERQREMFAQGKMLGVLVVSGCKDMEDIPRLEGFDGLARTESGDIGFIAAFSGTVGNSSRVEGFVPPVFDLLVPGGKYRTGEEEISAINREVAAMESSDSYIADVSRLVALKKESEEVLGRMKKEMAQSKIRRAALRETCPESERETLVRESQFEKAELGRARKRFAAMAAETEGRIREHESRIAELKSRRAVMSDRLQKWIFRHFVVRNAAGEEKGIGEIFGEKGLVPPAGTGECAAPKLLQYAYLRGLRPLYMGEFWYGLSPEGPVRNHGDFYPSCSGKCGVLLPFMMQGLELEGETARFDPPHIVYEDEWILAVDKPGGMPSVPGLDGRVSALEWFRKDYPGLETVHRLDMDTCGLLLFAKDRETAAVMHRQFEDRTVSKTYRAVLCPSADGRALVPGDKGVIDLPLAPDYEDRPRQKVDRAMGKRAVTGYEVCGLLDGGYIQVIFRPHDGRTHQLRVHAAHSAGLGHPILGDRLYGGAKKECPLQLQAFSVVFNHPVTGLRIRLESDYEPVHSVFHT